MRLYLCLFATCITLAVSADLKPSARMPGEKCSLTSDCSFPYVCKRQKEKDVYQTCGRKAKKGSYCELSDHCDGKGVRYGVLCIENKCTNSTGDKVQLCKVSGNCKPQYICSLGSADSKERKCRDKSYTNKYCESTAHCEKEDDICMDKICRVSTGDYLDRCKNDRRCQRQLVCSKKSPKSTSRRCRYMAASGEYCEKSEHCDEKEDGCFEGMCTPGKGQRRGLSTVKILGIAVGVVVGVMVIFLVILYTLTAMGVKLRGFDPRY